MHGVSRILLLPSPLPPHLSNSFYSTDAMHGVSIIRMAHFLFARQYIIICTVQTPCMASLSFAWRIFFRMAILSSARYRRHAWRLYRMHGAFFILLLPSPLPPHQSNSFYTPSTFLSLALLTKWQWRFWW